MRNIPVILILCLCLLLSACGAEAPEAPEATPEAPAEAEIGGSSVPIDAAELRLRPGAWTLEALCAAAPQLTALRTLSIEGEALAPEALSALREAFPQAALTADLAIGGAPCPITAEELHLLSGDWSLEQLCAAAPWLTSLRTLDFGDQALEPETLSALHEAFPQAEISAPVSALGLRFTGEETALDLSAVDPARLDEICALLPWLPALTQIETVPTEGESLWQLDALCALREAAPAEAAISCRFTLFEQPVSSEDEEIVYYRHPIGDDNLPTLRRALPLLRSCRRLLLDDCDLLYADLAELREQFPERGLVWRVRFGVDSVLTDTQRIWSVAVTNENCDVLKYCTEVLYFDVGHTLELSDFHFIPYMTKLQVLIVARTGFSDCELLTHCPDLEYLEIFSSEVTDLTPLAECRNLEHLNISNLPEVTDISPLYGLTKLKRLMIVMDNVPEEQKAEITALLPDCAMMFYAVNPTDNGWRRDRLNQYVPRYALLRQQLGYDGYNSPEDFINWADIEALGINRKSVFTRS